MLCSEMLYTSPEAAVACGAGLICLNYISMLLVRRTELWQSIALELNMLEVAQPGLTS